MENAVSYIKAELTSRQDRNPAYSLRAFARDLSVSHAYVSQVMNGKKRISAHQARWLGETLGMRPAVVEKMVDAALATEKPKLPPKETKRFIKASVDKLRATGEWYHLAILDLIELSDFQPSLAWISKRLGITEKTAKAAVRRLERLGLLIRDSKGWRKGSEFLSFPTQRSHSCVRQLHRDLIGKALENLSSGKKTDFDARLIAGAMIPCNPERLEEAKQRIHRFRREIIRFLSEGECRELYQLNVQLFPLTKAAETEEGAGQKVNAL